MKKLLILLICFIMFNYFIYTEETPEMINTLIIIDEQENDKFLLNNSTIADGIFDALWDMNKFIFFDMKIDSPIPVAFDVLDVKSYLKVARESGADSILLMKINYTTKEKGKNLIVEIKDVLYNLYSLNDSASLKSGTKKLNIIKSFSIKDKNLNMKKLGSTILKEIYD